MQREPVFLNEHVKSMTSTTSGMEKYRTHSPKPVNQSEGATLRVYFEGSVRQMNRVPERYREGCPWRPGDDQVLLHWHTRSIANLLTKASQTFLAGKYLPDRNALAAFIRSSETHPLPDLYQHLGMKAKLASAGELHVKPLRLDHLTNSTGLQRVTTPVCAVELERAQAAEVLAGMNVTAAEFELKVATSSAATTVESPPPALGTPATSRERQPGVSCRR